MRGRACWQVWLERPVLEGPRQDTARAREAAARERVLDDRLYPTFCREAGTTYAGSLHADVCCQPLGGGEVQRSQRRLGSVPIMVRSALCSLRGMDKAALVGKHEEAHEMGGYFIINGNEKVGRKEGATARHACALLS